MTINIYTPTEPHQPAYIVVDQEGLKILKQMIDRAIETTENPISKQVFDSDGEQYELRLVCDPDDIQKIDSIKLLEAPYVEEYSRYSAFAWKQASNIWSILSKEN